MSKEEHSSLPAGALDGARIVVTRPAERGESLCRAITAAGGDALLFPTLRITPLGSAELHDHLPAPDWLVFTSVPSVEHGGELLDQKLPGWRERNIAAIGQATADALQEYGISSVARPPAGQQHSEGLLDCDGFTATSGQQVLIVRGEGGRRLLDETLRNAGVKVTSLPVYRREPAAVSPTQLLARWRENRVDAIVISSAEGLRALHAILDDEGRAQLRGSQLVLPTARVIKLAQDLGIQPEPVIASGASDEAVLAALADWWAGR